MSATPTDDDARFLRKWEQWHRRGQALYVLREMFRVTAFFAGAALVWHLIFTGTLGDWQTWQPRILPSLGGTALGVLLVAPSRFKRHEERYERLVRLRDFAAHGTVLNFPP